MAIGDEFAVTQFKIERVVMRVEGGELVTVADVSLYNAANVRIHQMRTDIPWTAGEETTILARLAAKQTAFATDTGWAVYTGEN